MAKRIGGEPEPEPELEQPEPKYQPGPVSHEALGIRDYGVDQGPKLPILSDMPPYLFCYHPNRWQVMSDDDGDHLVPQLGRLALIAGVSGVSLGKGDSGGLRINNALVEKARRGWKAIPLDVDGPGTSYLHSPLAGVYLDRWHTAHIGSSIVSYDPAGFCRWLRDLQARGVLPRYPAPHVLENRIVRTRSQLATCRDLARQNPSGEGAVHMLERLLEVLLQVQRDMPAPAAAQRPVGLSDLVR